MKHLALLLIAVLVFGQAFGDRGVVLTQDIELTEPAQRAIVAHNGTWELLILQTDVRSDSPTRTLEFMPLPSNPKVSLAAENCFSNLQALVKKYDMKYIVESPRRDINGPKGKSEDIMIVDKYDLEPHHITVVEIKDASKFRSWIIDFAKQEALGNLILSDDMDQIVKDYISRGFSFFAFDVLDLPNGTKTVAPVAYKFKCDHVYYPLKITNLYGGEGTVEVFYEINPWQDDNAERPRYFNLFRHQQIGRLGWVFSHEVNLSTDDLASLHPELAVMFPETSCHFFASKYEGNLYFTDDIWLNMGYSSPQYLALRFISLLQQGDFESIEFLIETPFEINRLFYTDVSQTIAALKKIIYNSNISSFQIRETIFSCDSKKYFNLKFFKIPQTDLKWGHWGFVLDTCELHLLITTGNPYFRIIGFNLLPRDDSPKKGVEKAP